MADIARAGPTTASVSDTDQRGIGRRIYRAIDEELTNTFGPINRGIEAVTGKPDPNRNLLMALNAIRAGPRFLPSIARYKGMGERRYTHPVINDQIDYFTINAQDRFNSRGVTGLTDQLPNYPMPNPGQFRTQPPMGGGSPGGPGGGGPVGPPSRDLILQALQQRANRGSNMPFLQQSRMEQSSAMPLNMQPPANTSMSPTGMSAQDTFRQALMRQLLGGQ